MSLKSMAGEVYGDDLDVLRAEASRVAERMRSIEGLADVVSSSEAGNPEIHVLFERDRIAYLTIGLETKDSIMVVCNKQTGGNFYRAYLLLKKYKDLGFIELDSSIAYKIDPDLDEKAKEYIELAGTYRPVQMSRGCIERFSNLDKRCQDCKNKEVVRTVATTVVVIGVASLLVIIIKRGIGGM